MGGPPDIPSNLPSLGIQAYLVYKVLGPSAGVMGSHLANLVDFAADNVGRVFRNAYHKLGDEVDEPGAVSPRALSKVIDEASFSDDDVVVDYLGGILASGRDPEGRDDQAVAWSQLVGRLSSRQLTLHYLLYAALREAVLGQDLNLGADEDRRKCRGYIPFWDLMPALGLQGESDWMPQFEEAFYGIHRENLVHYAFSFGSAEAVKQQAPGITEPGLAWGPTMAGIRLFLWGHGAGRQSHHVFVDPNYALRFESSPDVPSMSLRRDLEAAEGEKPPDDPDQ